MLFNLLLNLICIESIKVHNYHFNSQDFILKKLNSFTNEVNLNYPYRVRNIFLSNYQVFCK